MATLRTRDLLRIFLLYVVKEVFFHVVKCGITGPLNPLQYKDGDDALFKWSTDDGKPIYSADFGKRLTKGGTSVLQFMNINKYTKEKNFNSLYPEYKNRLDFIGNLTTGRAWFILKALTLNDTGKYIADIRDESGVLTSSVDLIVEKGAEKKEHVSTTTQEPSTSTAGNCSGLACTPTPTSSGPVYMKASQPGSTTPSPNDTTTITPTTTEPSGWSAGQIAGVVVGALAGAVVIVIIFIVVWKHYKKGQQDNPPTEKKQDTEMKTSTAAKA